MVKNVTIFCGSNAGNSHLYKDGAETLADVLSHAGMNLVYGGGKVGLMGLIADRMLANGSSVIGVIPQSLVDLEVAHDNLTELEVVDSMHARKARMSELADGFIMLPGGFGSLDEFFDVMTGSQLGYHAKPCAIMNIAGYYDGLLQFLDHVVKQGFMKQPHRDMIIVDHRPEVLIDGLLNYQAPSTTKWIKTAAVG